MLRTPRARIRRDAGSRLERCLCLRWLSLPPAPLALALVAFLTEFIPVLGAVPALLLALTQGGSTLIWTALLYLAVQQLESNVVTPLVQRRMVTIPPALLLFT